jgi:3-hydroxyacyl-CoA dehydrogenase/enoyl-CoA hydratase/3-hydroxybutyryl-CoA epimerase
MEIITAGKSVDGVKAWKLGLVVAHELAEAFRERMAVAPVLKRLHEQGLKGRKGDAGFYLYKGKHEKGNPEIAALVGRPVRHEARVLMEGDIPVRLIGVMIAEAKRCIEEGVVESEDDIDTGMVFGTGFPSFRGGLVHYAHDAGLW